MSRGTGCLDQTATARPRANATAGADGGELVRLLDRDLPELTPFLSPWLDDFPSLSVSEQAASFASIHFFHNLLSLMVDHDPGLTALAAYLGRLYRAERTHERSLDLRVLAFVSAIGIAMREKFDFASPELLAELEQVIRLVTSGYHQGALYEGEVENLVGDLIEQESELSRDEIQPMVNLVATWQTLMWTLESSRRGDLALSRSERMPLPDDPDAELDLLLRVAAQQPLLSQMPLLARFFPTEAEGYFGLGTEAIDRFRASAVPYEAPLACELARQIGEERHYLLDHIARIDTDGACGVSELILAPEQGYSNCDAVQFLVRHEAGLLAGELTLPLDGSEPSCFLPALRWHFTRDRFDDEERFIDYQEEQAAIELMVLAAWRDLVVADVREEQYETTLVRKAKTPAAKSSARAKRRAPTEIIHYLPRRVAARRAVETSRAGSGAHALRQLFRVGVFAKQLPEGQHRSADADQFAREIRMPLAEHQTIVRAHWRGGTAEERELAEAVETVPVKQWRSWSALDLLRSRRAES